MSLLIRLKMLLVQQAVKVKVADQMAFNATNKDKAVFLPTEHSVTGDETYGIWDKDGDLGGGRVGGKNINDTSLPGICVANSTVGMLILRRIKHSSTLLS